MPYVGQKPLLEQVAGHLTGKVVVDVVAPLAVTKGRAKAVTVEDGSAPWRPSSFSPTPTWLPAFRT